MSSQPYFTLSSDAAHCISTILHYPIEDAQIDPCIEISKIDRQHIVLRTPYPRVASETLNDDIAKIVASDFMSAHGSWPRPVFVWVGGVSYLIIA